MVSKLAPHYLRYLCLEFVYEIMRLRMVYRSFSNVRTEQNKNRFSLLQSRKGVSLCNYLFYCLRSISVNFSHLVKAQFSCYELRTFLMIDFSAPIKVA